MEQITQTLNAESDLLVFTKKLKEESYDKIERLCANVLMQVQTLEQRESAQRTSQYLRTCRDIATRIEGYVTTRKDRYLPYLEELSEKVRDQHNCSECSGGCKINHDMQVIELKASAATIKSILGTLQTAVLPLYSDTVYPDAYRVLRNQMALLEDSMAELFLLEENYLLPKVVQAQKAINAGHK
jgi:hypothetical protein